MKKSFWAKWQLGFLTVAIAGLLVIGLTRRSTPPQIRDIMDEGGAPPAVKIRIKAKFGDHSSMAIRGRASYRGQQASSDFTCYADTRVTEVTGSAFTVELNIGSFTMHQDDLKIEAILKPSLEKSLTTTSDERGNIINTTSSYAVPSYNLPTGPVKAGQSWRGEEKSDDFRGPLKFTLEKIIRSRGHDIAIVKRDYPAAQNKVTRDWFDTTDGSIIKTSERIATLLPNGRIMDIVTDAQSDD